MAKRTRFPVLGFIGTGTITSALVTGFCKRAPEYPYSIVVSPRNEHKAAALKKAYPDRVTVAESLQEVADRSDWIVLAVVPEAGEEVCRGIRFRPEHKVINLLADKTLQQVRSWIGETAVLLHMVPLTFNALCNSPIVLCPPHEEAAEVFGHIGNMVQVEKRYQAAVLAAITGCVTPFFSLLNTLIEWVRSQGVPNELATGYITAFFHAVCEQAIQSNEQEVYTLAEESTPGGVNYIVKDILTEQDGFKIWVKAMDAAIKRIAANIPPDF